MPVSRTVALGLLGRRGPHSRLATGALVLAFATVAYGVVFAGKL